MWPKARAAVPLWLRLALLAALLAAAVAGQHPHRGARGLWGDEDEDEDLDGVGGEDADEDYAEDDAGGGGGDDAAEVEDALVNVQLTQFDYSDACANLADARWQWLLAGEPGSGPQEALLWEREAGVAASARRNVAFMQGYSDLRERVPKAPASVLDEIDYSLHAGDLLLPEAAFMQKLNFSRAVQRSLSDLRVPCEGDADADCVMTLPVVRRVLSRSGDAAQQLRAWRGAQAALRPLARAFPAQLALARAAAAANGVAPAEGEDGEGEEDGAEGAGAVGAYWVRLLDPDDFLDMTFARARQLWEQVRPLHRKLAGFVRARLAAVHGEAALAVDGAPPAPDEPLLPAHLTGSLLGDDWSALADLVYPSARLRALDHALDEKGLKGRALYETALETLNASLGIEGLPSEDLLKQVRYDGECPTRFVQNCSSASRALACATAGWQEYAEAHEVMSRLAHEHLGAAEDKKNLIRVATRYSATHDMLASVIRLLSLHPDRLEEVGALPDEDDYEELWAAAEASDSEDDDEVHRGEATLRLLVALRALPRLAYLAAGDAFRLRLLAALADHAHPPAHPTGDNATATATAPAPVDPVALWARVRREYMLVAAAPGEGGDAAWLADAALAGNEPLLGRFMAELLAFQALEYLASYDPAHPLSATRSDARIPVLMQLGRAQRWPEMLNDQLDINEIRAEPLLRYFKPLARLLTAEAAAKAAPAAKREAVDLTPPVPPPPAPSAPSLADAFAGDAEPSAEALPALPADPSASAPMQLPGAGGGGDDDGAGDGAADDGAPAAPAQPSTTDGPARASVGAAEEATARTAVLAASLAVFGAALAAGAVVAGRRLLTKRRYQRNRRPDADAPPKAANGDVEAAAAAVPEEAEPANPDANQAEIVNVIIV
ncbi:hypothetical protein R5R35_009362 [Gryllus longicercus]|uniref:Uncharacterized protein n=1 Tax=Gryllus longicercus TaxID=2509291 RepID=A0AAN9YZZ5_9ORTH